MKISTEEIEANFRPRYNIAPSQEVGVIRSQGTEDSTEWVQMVWGLVPAWAKQRNLGFNTINARSDKVADSPVYRKPYHAQRCLVPATGFYEWKAGTKPKQPFYFFPSEAHETFAFAALWDEWRDPDGSGEPLLTFSLLTTEANAVMEPVHHRMPVILTDEEQRVWLGETEGGSIDQLLKPCAAELMTCHRVSTWVNKTSNDGPEAIREEEILEWDF